MIDFQCSELYEQNDFLVFKLGDSRQYLQSFERIQQLLLRPCNRSRILREFYDIISNLEEEQIANRDILEPVMKYMELRCGLGLKHCGYKQMRLLQILVDYSEVSPWEGHIHCPRRHFVITYILAAASFFRFSPAKLIPTIPTRIRITPIP